MSNNFSLCRLTIPKSDDTRELLRIARITNAASFVQ